MIAVITDMYPLSRRCPRRGTAPARLQPTIDLLEAEQRTNGGNDHVDDDRRVRGGGSKKADDVHGGSPFRTRSYRP